MFEGRLSKRLKDHIGNLLGTGLEDLFGQAERRQQVLLAATIGMAVGLPFSVFNMSTDGSFIVGMTELAAVCFLVFPAALLAQRSVGLAFAEGLVLLAGLVIFGTLIAFRGIQGTAQFWGFMFPFLAFFLKGQRRGWLYSCGFALIVATYFAIGPAALPFAYQYTRTYGAHYVVTLICFTVIAAGFNLLRSRFEEKLQARVAERTATAKVYLNQLQYQATHDPLTGLPNRVKLTETIASEIEKASATGQGLVICNLHLERLFELGNVLGIAGADALVLQIAEHLGRIAEGEGYLSRTRRDEFVILYRIDRPTVSPDELQRFIAEREFSIQVQGYAIHIEFTLGLSISPAHSNDPELLLKKAEQAMLQARKNEQRWSIYDEKQEEVFVRHHLLFGKMQEGLRLRQFQVHFQPQVDLATGVVIGAEALTRWADPIEGMISPVVFIPVAEESGLIQPLTNWLVRVCMSESARWKELGLDLDISINLSAISLVDPNLIDFLRNTAAEAGLAPEKINLEITESCFIKSPERSLEVMRRLREAGFRLSIDDFGTGFSSLSYLKNMPINELKIDQSFVRKLLESPGDQSIVISTIDLAHNFGLSVVAEGIEDEPTATWLREHHCDIGQGYTFARPIPAAEMVLFAQSRQAGRAAVESN
ncbi:MAG: EAL domain-containing protein [Proteobacteria bacterium]|nr:EAL domain-containing protein [Pseudomonadota bacterium]